MLTAGQGSTSWLSISPWRIYSGLSAITALLLCLFIAIRHFTRHQKPYPYPGANQQDQNPWREASKMEKGTKPNTSPPPATACDVLKPLSSTGEFPSSGAVAAHAREQMATGGKSPGSSSSATQAGSPSQSTSSNESPDAVQRRKETVQQMREEDSNGVRTWRRLIVEYN